MATTQNITIQQSTNEIRQQEQSQQQRNKLFQKIITHVVLIALSLIFIIPFFWMVTGSLKVDSQLSAFPIVWFPDPVTLEHYIYGLTVVPFGLYVINTLLICLFSVI